jgi:hypothetical protein
MEKSNRVEQWQYVTNEDRERKPHMLGAKQGGDLDPIGDAKNPSDCSESVAEHMLADHAAYEHWE